MPLKLIENIWKSNESGLGFYCVNIFKILKANPSLNYLLNNNILNDEQFGNCQNKVISKSTELYGSIILNKLEETDFQNLSFNELKYEIEKYWKDEDWGVDLQIFKENFELAISNISKYSIEKRKYFLLNTEKIHSEKLTNPNFFTYLVCIISTLKDSNEVITLTFGLD